jgi:hypothetical protein
MTTTADKKNHNLIIVEGASEKKLLEAIVSSLSHCYHSINVEKTDGIAKFPKKARFFIDGIPSNKLEAKILLIWNQLHPHIPNSQAQKDKVFRQFFIDQSLRLRHGDILNDVKIVNREGISTRFHFSLYEMPGIEIAEGHDMQALWLQTLEPTKRAQIEQYIQKCLPDVALPDIAFAKRCEHAFLAYYEPKPEPESNNLPKRKFFSSFGDGDLSTTEAEKLFNVSHEAYQPLIKHIELLFNVRLSPAAPPTQ